MANPSESAAHSQLLSDDAATARFGAALASRLRPGELVLLVGALGLGKTALARAVIRTLAGNPGLDVPSPSFALVQPYDTPAGPVLHADLYRLADAAEIDELGLFDDSAAIVLVEWPERAPRLFGMADWIVSLAMAGTGRRVTVTGKEAPR